MSGDTYFEVMTMGDFQVGRRKIRTKAVRPLDTGCFWFRDCEKCGWEGCVTRCIDQYDSARARTMRGEAFGVMLRAGLPLHGIAEFFGVAERDVLEVAGMASCPGRKFDDDSREAAKAEVIRRRASGEAEASVAMVIGVSSRTVRSWYGAGPGHNAGASNRPRKAAQPVTVAVIPEYLSERCEVLRARFK